jgi:hypothetical protein
MKQKSMVHLIFIVVLAGWHNLLPSARIATGKLETTCRTRRTRPTTSQKHRIIKHLREVEEANRGKPRRSKYLYIKECNSSFPRDNPICTAILFGEEDYFLDDKTRSDPPSDGWRLEVFY